jgi:hypothetical protein
MDWAALLVSAAGLSGLVAILCIVGWLRLRSRPRYQSIEDEIESLFERDDFDDIDA